MELARPLQAECAPRHNRIRVLVVSDVLLYREGLTASLKGEAGLEVIDAISGSGAIAQVQVLAPDIMLLDASLRDSLALAREVRCLTPGVRVVGFGVTMAERGILACAEAGLAGFVGTDGTVEELVTAIERAMREELLRPPRIVARLFDRVAELAREALIGFWGDGGTSQDQSRDEGAKESFASAAGVVHEFEEAEIERQLLLRDAPVWPQPGA